MEPQRGAVRDDRAASAPRRAPVGGGGAPGGADARLLALQREAGNRAVTAMLQREITWQPKDLEVGRSWKDRVRTTFAADTYSMIIEALKDFHKARDPKTKLYLARVLEWRSENWLQRHGDRKAAREQTQKRMIENLHAEALREVGKLRAEAVYLRDMQKPGGFQGLNPQVKGSGLYAEKAVGLAAGEAPGGEGADEAAAEIVAKYKLSAAEIAAIRTFTLPDYSYINPVAGGSDSRLTSNVLRAKDPRMRQEFGPRPTVGDGLGPGMKLLKSEGALHAGMLTQALSKLPKYDKLTYRGRRMSPEEFKSKYGGQKVDSESFPSFSSATKNPVIAQGYADGTAGDVRPKDEDTVSVVYEIQLTDGRDISMLSAAMTLVNEEEVLILPGAELQVGEVTPVKGGAGKPAATAWYRIKLTQVK